MLVRNSFLKRNNYMYQSSLASIFSFCQGEYLGLYRCVLSKLKAQYVKKIVKILKFFIETLHIIVAPYDY